MACKTIVLFFVFLFISCSSPRKTGITNDSKLQKRFLILTADDYGASKNINEGIKLAVQNNSVTAISVLSNFNNSLSDLKELSEKYPNVNIGVHLNIVTGSPILGLDQVPSLVTPTGEFYTIESILHIIRTISVDELRKELKAQILILKEYGIRVEYLSDQCGILTYYNPFFDVLIELAKEFNVPVRTPICASKKYPRLFCNSMMKKRYRQIAIKCAVTAPFKALSLLKYSKIDEMEKKAQKLDKLGIIHPDLLIECFWGDPTASNLLHILEHLPNGTSELILHFGTFTRQEDYPTGLDQNYFKNRENELITVTSEYLKEYYDYLNIQTIGYSDLVTKRGFVDSKVGRSED